MSNTKEKAPVNWHFTCQITHIYENFKEHAKYKLTVWRIQSLILMIKMIWKRNWMTWLGCTRQCKKKKKLKTASYSEQIQILTLVPNKLSRMYCSEYFNVFECLVWTSHEIKKVGEILTKLVSEKRKNCRHWNTSSSNKRFWRWQFQ